MFPQPPLKAKQTPRPRCPSGSKGQGDCQVRLSLNVLTVIMKATTEGMMAAQRNVEKRSCHDAPGTERKDQAQGRDDKNLESES